VKSTPLKAETKQFKANKTKGPMGDFAFNATFGGVTRVLRTATDQIPRMNAKLVYLLAWSNMSLWVDLHLKTIQIPSAHHTYINATLL